MSGPSWLAWSFAAVMILTAAYSASRLAFSRLRGRATEFDADALHAVMGVAMAGMLVPGLSALPDGAWVAVFGMGTAWFGWHAVRAWASRTSGGSPARFQVPHLIECVAMLYMLLPVHGSGPAHGGAGMAMAGMGASAGPGGFPALAVVLALFMLGYIVWTTDRLAALARARATPPPAQTAAPPHGADGAVGTPAGASTGHPNQAGGPMLAPTLAACGKLAMSITMGYMLILML